MEIKEYIDRIKKLSACDEALKEAIGYQTSQELWVDCKRGDWMLWLVGKLSGGPQSDKRKQLVLTACKCARLSLPYVKKGDTRPLRAIETAEKWTRSEATIEEVRAAAADAAYTAAYAAAAYTAADYAAAAAAYAAVAAAVAAVAAVAAAAAAVAAVAAAYDARLEILQQCADIVRQVYPNVDELWI